MLKTGRRRTMNVGWRTCGYENQNIPFGRLISVNKRGRSARFRCQALLALTCNCGKCNEPGLSAHWRAGHILRTFHWGGKASGGGGRSIRLHGRRISFSVYDTRLDRRWNYDNIFSLCHTFRTKFSLRMIRMSYKFILTSIAAISTTQQAKQIRLDGLMGKRHFS